MRNLCSVIYPNRCNIVLFNILLVNGGIHDWRSRNPYGSAEPQLKIVGLYGMRKICFLLSTVNKYPDNVWNWQSSFSRRTYWNFGLIVKLTMITHHLHCTMTESAETGTIGNRLSVRSMAQALWAKAISLSASLVRNSMSFDCRYAQIVSSLRHMLMAELFHIAYSEHHD